MTYDKDLAEFERSLRESDDRFRAAHAATNVCLWSCAPDGKMIGRQLAWSQLTGQQYDDYQGFGWTRVIHPDDMADTFERWNTAAVQKEIFECDHRLKDKNTGGWRFYTMRVAPVLDSGGEIAEWIGAHTDTSSHHARQTALLSSEMRMEAIINASLDAIISIDENGDILDFSPSAERIFGYAREEVVGRSMERLIIPSRLRKKHRAGLKRFLDTGETRILDQLLELPALRADGSEFPIEIAIVAIMDLRPRMFTAFIRDITERKRVAEHEKLLMGEVNHRAKNLLSVVQGIARQMEKTGDVASFVEKFSSRLTGLSGVQDLLVTSSWRGADMRTLVEKQLGYMADSFGTRIKINGPDIILSAKAAQTVGMALHELSTNSVKYGALSSSSGGVEIGWRLEGSAPPAFEMHWLEHGGPRVRKPQIYGFGHKLMVDMPKHSFEACVEIIYNPEGIEWRLTAPAQKLLQEE